MDKRLLRAFEEKGTNDGACTSIVKSSSIFMALPNMKMYCMRFENSHMLRSLSSKLRSGADSGAGSVDSISSRARFPMSGSLILI